MKKLFIIGASILQLPAIKKAREMGLYVGVADYNPQAIGVEYAQEYFNVSTIDEKGIYEAAKKFGADGIMTLATDMPMRSVAYACERLGLSGVSYDTAVKATDKGEMIKAFEKNNVAHPWFYIVKGVQDIEGISDKISYPCISKPTDNSGSRGVMLIKDEQELFNSVSYSSENGRSGSVIIEEYMQGSEVSVEVMVIDGCVNILAVTDKLTTGAPHFVEMGHSQPSMLSESAVKAIKKLAEGAVRAVGIKTGPAHVEIMLTKEGPKMIELGARMGGDCITTHLVPLSTGIDMVKATIVSALGQNPDITPQLSCGSAIRYFHTDSGVIEKIEGREAALTLDGVQDVVFVKSEGENISGIGSSVDRTGYVIAQGRDAADAVHICEEAASRINIKVRR